MNYHTQNTEVVDHNYFRFVGWKESNPCIQKYYCNETVYLIQRKIAELTRGIEKNKIFLVPCERIREVMDAVFQNFRPNVGDIYSRYIIPNDEQENMVQSMIDQTIEAITDHIKNEYQMRKANEALNPWVQLYGDFNPHNLTQTPPIKVRDKRPSTMQFNMNY